ncbi:cadherin repeat domain-containing protein [Cellulosilyticum ruminicola]|uniref:cadherin repeat domain-containing protein n=1 Tax=Cellulosilyticum ruminicola TaxID=425254 RepID=UPI0006D18BEA|nr:cadherin repeat domain-containing protein [Cellulosilyticum ruminicola]
MKKQIKKKLFHYIVKKTYFLLGSLLIGIMLLLILVTHTSKGSYITINDANIQFTGNTYWIDAIWEDEKNIGKDFEEGQEVIWFKDASSNRHTGIIKYVKCLNKEVPKQYEFSIEVTEEVVKKEFKLPLEDSTTVLVEIKVKDVPILLKGEA